jgi:methionyl-tRNA synthetase
MSKSRGTFIMAKSYLEHLNPEYLRYYFATKLNSKIDDLDLNLEDFVQRVNSDLVGKVVNIASRCAGFVKKKFDGKLAETWSTEATELYQSIVKDTDKIAALYEKREFAHAMRETMAIADRANEYIDETAPWVLAKEAGKEKELHESVSLGINLFRVLISLLSPVLPVTAEKARAFLQLDDYTWDAIQTPLMGHEITKFKPLMTRVEMADVEKMVEASKADAKSAMPVQKEIKKTKIEPIANEISFEDFAKIDFRIAKIINAEHIPKANKLLKLTLDIGVAEKQVFAGIKSAYQPEELIGKLTVMVANLAPRKMSFGMSEGMVLAAGPGGEDLFLLNPDEGATVGMRVK